MLEHEDLYDALYLLAAGEGRADALFGSCQPLAREAFRRSLIGDEFPTVWFEVPLAGAPRFDLHVALARGALRAGAGFAAGAGSGYDELFRWYAEEEPGGLGLAFAYDVSEGRIDRPAVHVNVNGAPLARMDRFFELVAGEGGAGAGAGAAGAAGAGAAGAGAVGAAGMAAAERYRAFEARLPGGWAVWYAGFHPGRPGAPVRVDCFVDARRQAAYARDPALLERHLRECGVPADAAGGALRDLAGLVLESPFGLELQFDVLEDGSCGSTVGVSAGFGSMQAPQLRRLFEDGGAAAALLGQVEARGLADSRWRLLPQACFARLVGGEDGPLALYNSLTFVKLRVREGRPLDAKAYLQAGACVLRAGDAS